MEGKAPYYTRAGEMGLLYVPFGDEGSPLDERVGRHIPTVSTLLEVFSLHNPDWAIIVDNLPSLSGAFAFSAFLYPHARRFALRRPYLPLGRWDCCGGPFTRPTPWRPCARYSRAPRKPNPNRILGVS